jgi:hypothetical protein
MRTRQWVPGLNNSQRIRAIVNGVGFITTVKDALNGPFSTQTNAMYSALIGLANAKKNDTLACGYGRTIKVYDNKMQSVSFEIQVNLI